MDRRDHAFVQDSPNVYARIALTIEDDVLALLDSAESGKDLAALPSQQWISGHSVATGSQLIEIAYRLCFTPTIHCVVVDFFHFPDSRR